MHRSRTSALALAITCGCKATAVSRGVSLVSPDGPPEPRCPTERVVLAQQDDIAKLAPCVQLGGVTLRSGAALDASGLAALRTIRGDLVIGPTIAMSEISLPALVRVEGAIRVIGNNTARGLFMPQLETARSIAIEGNVALATVSLPRIEQVDRTLRVTDNASLEVIDVATLAKVGGELVVGGVPRLAVVVTRELWSAESVAIDAPKLAPERVAELRQAAHR